MNKESENKEVCQKGNELGRNSFLCIQCLTPSKTLYKVSGISVKLTRCSKCEAVIDPYIERELLLVAMDIILHRKEAMRHLIFHRYLQFWNNHTNGVKEDNGLRGCVIKCTLSMILLIIEELIIETSLSDGSIDSVWSLLLNFVKEFTFFVIPLFAAVCFIISRDSLDASSYIMITRIFHSVVFPSIFVNALLIFMLVYEKSQVLLFISTLFKFSIQVMSITSVMECNGTLQKGTLNFCVVIISIFLSCKVFLEWRLIPPYDDHNFKEQEYNEWNF